MVATSISPSFNTFVKICVAFLTQLWLNHDEPKRVWLVNVGENVNIDADIDTNPNSGAFLPGDLA